MIPVLAAKNGKHENETEVFAWKRGMIYCGKYFFDACYLLLVAPGE